jgi:phage tail-like protein
LALAAFPDVSLREGRRMTQPTDQTHAPYSAAHFALELDDGKDIGMFRSIEGGGIKSDVLTYQNGGTYDRWRQLGRPKFEDIKLQVGTSMSEGFYKWIAAFFGGNPVRKNGTILAADYYYKTRARRVFTDAMIKELVFPKLDATDKNTTFMNITLGVENITFEKGDDRVIQQRKDDAQKAWKGCNFNFSLDPFTEACTRVTKIESFTIKQNLLEYAWGGLRTVTKTPSTIDIPQLSFSLPEMYAGPMITHYVKRGVKGEVPGRFNGMIETYDNSAEKTVCFRITIKNADILNVAPDKSDAASEEMKQVKVDLYCEGLEFAYYPAGELPDRNEK